MRPSCGRTCTASQGGRDFYLQFADGIDAGVQLVPRLHGTHARRRPGVDEVARLEGVELGEIGALALLAVHAEPEGASGRMADFLRRRERAAGCRFVEVLAEIPGPPVVLPPLLQVATRHVEADRIAEDMVVSLPRVDAVPTLGDRHYHFRLVVVVGRLR